MTREKVCLGIAWLRRHIDPFTLKAAVRAAIVMPAVFGFADQVIGNTDTTLFSAFGSFAISCLLWRKAISPLRRRYSVKPAT